MLRSVATMFAIALLAAKVATVAAAEPAPIRVMSFNLRNGHAKDGENRWEKRNWLVARTIRQFAPDLLGTQETFRFQAEYLQRQLEGFTYFGRSRMKQPNEHCGIFFRTDRFTQLAGGHFWLSETPDIPGSKSWDSALPRMATWVLLTDRKNETAPPILFVNTHFDHRGKEVCAESARLIRRRIDRLKTIAKNTVTILTGDFNTPEASMPYTNLLDGNTDLVDTYRVANPTRADNEGTFSGFKGTTSGPRIDWILASPRLSTKSAAIDHTDEDGQNPSDHFPVTAVLEVK